MSYTVPVEKRERKKPGPKPKAEEEKLVPKSFKFHREEWSEIKRWIPAGQRSDLVRKCLARAVAVRKRRAAETDGDE